ncbi:DUF2817 domain-containing protein [Zavarzinia sp. CC-PAN008]|uniref:DUF2817 domain-containing protein n=1 Tax=Zavarzinia sp. CC-PAN008 TaxID=3243332 RepID=UPI003F74668D
MADPFSADHAQARGRFLTAAQARRLPLVSHVHPLRGPRDEELACDVVRLGPADAGRILLLVAGTHGVEGFFGTAALLDALEGGIAPPAGCAILMVHALNPHGHAHLRRVTEGNVDLNRNFVDFAGPLPPAPDYDAIDAGVNPQALDAAALAQADAVLRAFQKAHGAAALQAAITRGQYHRPGGIYFGGTAPTWSRQLVETLCASDLARAERLVVLDFHTGLGAPGSAELISEAAADSAELARASAWFGPQVASAAAGQSLSAAVHGSLDSGLAHLCPHAERTILCLEVGTVSAVEVLRALRADNWLHQWGTPHGPRTQAIKAAIRAAFFPDTPDWKTQVTGHARATLRLALAALAER